jgi:hypothetical protein
MNAKTVVIAVVLVIVVGIPIFILEQLNDKLNRLSFLDMRLRLIQRSILYDCHCGGPLLKIADSTESRMQDPVPEELAFMLRQSCPDPARELRRPPSGNLESNPCCNRECPPISGLIRKTMDSSDGTIGRVFIRAF